VSGTNHAIVLALIAACTSGCKEKPSDREHSPDKPGSQNTPPPAKPQSSIVFASGTATLYTAPDEKAPNATLETRNVPRALRLIERNGDWVEVETIGDHRGELGRMKPGVGGSPVTCHENLDGLSAFRLRLFVRSSDLLAVSTKPIRINNPDGTWAEIETGVAVGSASAARDAKGHRRTVFSRFSFDTVLPEESLGDSFVATKFTELEPERDYSMRLSAADAGPTPDAGHKSQYVHWGTEATFDGQTITLWPRHLDDNIAADEVQPAGDQRLVTIGEDCVKLRVLVGADKITDKPFSGHVHPRWPKHLEGNKAKKGATIYWRNGDRAGVVQTAASMGATAGSGTNRHCFSRSLLGARIPYDDDPVLTLCLDPLDIE
jgi:hypothetical protein